MIKKFLNEKNEKLNNKDYITIFIILLIYGILSFVNLGSYENPQSFYSFKNGDVIIRCVLDRIYYKELNNGDIEYYVEVNGEEKTLNQYLIDESITVVTIPQQFLRRKSD